VAGLLSRLFGRPESTRLVIEATVYPGTEALEVVGESRYQGALWQIVGGFRHDPVRHAVNAVLLPEPDNRYDSNAVRVLVEGQLVGYLSRDDAAAYQPGLLRLVGVCATGHVALEGQIVGGGPRSDGIGFLGVFLDHNPLDFGIAPHYTTGGSLRTGLSEAIATDLEDDDYDLSWLGTLPDDDNVAVGQLKALLEDERDPIDRHYMLCELERRLYQSRDERPSALEEFDSICARHHEEMVSLRPALLSKFGSIPVIEMYRQASIRCQKQKHWEAARDWAQRGLDVYGDEAARPEVIDDLHKRLAHATAKIEAPTQTKRKSRSVSVATATAELVSETLICGSCGASFERERTRGRKPKTCPTCRRPSRPVPSP
jgi:rubrerythrin